MEYEKRLQTFLRMSADCEDSAIGTGRLGGDQWLSGHIRQSWGSGHF